MKKFALAFLLLYSSAQVWGQTTWTGAINSDWSNAANWSSGVPDATDDVVIPDMANDPVVNTTAAAQSVHIQLGALLTVSTTNSLTLNNATNFSILNDGTIQNNGTISIGSTSSAGDFGIRNFGQFTNSSGASLNIDQVLFGLRNEFSGPVFDNHGTINIGSIGFSGGETLLNLSTFNNNMGGQIIINNGGLNNQAGTFSNAGTIQIGNMPQTILSDGLSNTGTFNNLVPGQITINRMIIGLINSTAGTFNNYSSIEIGSVQMGQYGLENSNTFNNFSGGQININRTTQVALITGGTFSNQSMISIGAESNVGLYGLGILEGTFSNNSGGQLTIDGTSYNAVIINSGTLNNQSTITMGSIQNVVNGIEIYGLGTVNNNTSGSIIMDRIGGAGVFVNHWNAIFNNQGGISMRANVAVSGNFGILNKGTFNNTSGSIDINRVNTYGIQNSNFPGQTATFNNSATLTLGAIGSAGNEGIRNQSFFNNNTGGTITINQTNFYGIVNSTGTFTNSAAIHIGTMQNVGFHGLNTGSTFINHINGQINIDRSSDVGLVCGSGNLTNHGTISIGANNSVGYWGLQIDFINSFTNSATGTIHIDRATQAGITLIGGDINNYGTLVVGALVPISQLLYGILPTPLLINHTGAVIKGTGTLSALNFSNTGGKISPGYSPGTMTFDADEFFSTSIIDIEIYGTNVGQFDKVVVNGTASLGSSTALEVSLGYTPAIGDQFQILSATTVTGTFSSTSLPPLQAGQAWEVQYNSNNITLLVTVVSVLPPACTALTDPANAATNVPANTPLSWPAASGSPDGYRLDVGTTPGGTDILNNFDVGNVTTYDPPGLFPYGTTIYVKIVPYNGSGPASGCTGQSFTTGNCIANLTLSFETLMSGTYRSQGDLNAFNIIIPTGQTVIFTSDTGIIIPNDFTVDVGAVFTAEIQTCP